MKMIEVEGLTRRFVQFTASDHISFEVERGEIFGFIGPNGAGKTNTTGLGSRVKP
jgi:ABC-type multidrug transport system ATPase subunit